MATKPTTNPVFATDATFDSDGAPNKIDLPAVLRANGWERDEVLGAEHVNHVLNAHGQWIEWSEESIDDLEARFDLDGEIALPAPLQGITYIGGRALCRPTEADWIRLNPTGGGWESRAARAPGYFDLTQRVSRYASFVRVRVLVNPGVARGAGGDRIAVTLRRSTFGISFTAPAPSITDTDVGSATDDGSTDLQWILIDLSGAPVAVSDGQTWELHVICGVDSNSNYDSVHAVALEMRTEAIGVL